MKKEEIIDFINRYHLGGKIESAAWTFDGGNVTTIFRSGDKSFMGKVNKTGFGFGEDCQIGILTTGQLVKLLGIMSDEFEFGLNKHMPIPTVTVNKAAKKYENLVIARGRSNSEVFS